MIEGEKAEVRLIEKARRAFEREVNLREYLVFRKARATSERIWARYGAGRDS